MRTQEMSRADYEGLLAWWRDQRAKAGPQEARRLDASLAEWKACTRIRESRALVLESAPDPAALRQAAINEAVATALVQHEGARKATRKAAKRAATEAAAARILQEQQQLAAQFSEAAVGRSLQEASSDDLAAIAATALSGTGQPRPAARPVAEMTVDPAALSIEDMGVAALAGSAGSSPFWQAAPGGSPSAGQSPFWRGLQVSGASKGTVDA